MVRFLAPALVLIGLPLWGADLGRTDRLWRDYLAETVGRGLPVVSVEANPSSIPYWPTLDRDRREAASLEPGADAVLVGSWMDLHEGAVSLAVQALRAAWPDPPLTRFPPRSWGETLFSAWSPEDSETWTQAWLAWEDKAYSVPTLVRGLEVLETSDPSAILPLLAQALRLYPEDRRLLPLVLRHPDSVVLPQALLARDLAASGGWSDGGLRHLLTRSPGSKEALAKAGYPVARLDAALTQDYGTWLAAGSQGTPRDGVWTWDAHQSGTADSSLVFQGGHLVTWSRRSADSFWTLAFDQGKPQSVTERRGGGRWSLVYESYPWAQDLEYRWGDTTMVYRFRPLTLTVPLWPVERFTAPVEALPAALADLWIPLDAGALVNQAATVETWVAGVKVRTVFLSQGQVWLTEEDSQRSGHVDTWSYFRAGKLASVYHDVEGVGRPNVRELYDKGRLVEVQGQTVPGARAEFALFPQEGVQLWDPQRTGRPLDRIFVWSGGDRLDALVFSGESLPWDTMPPWESRP